MSFGEGDLHKRVEALEAALRGMWHDLDFACAVADGALDSITYGAIAETWAGKLDELGVRHG